MTVQNRPSGGGVHVLIIALRDAPKLSMYKVIEFVFGREFDSRHLHHPHNHLLRGCQGFDGIR